MVDTVVEIVAHACILLCSAVLYVFLVARIFPHLLLKPKYRLSVLQDRGSRKYVFKNGRAIVYEPSIQAARYIKQYILSCNGGEKYIKCKIDERIRTIKYDVIAMDADDKEIATVRIAEPIYNTGVTKGALLPPDTSYVCVIVKEVNDHIVEPVTKLQLPMWRAGLYGLLTVVCSVIEGALWNASILKWFDMALYDFVSTGIEEFVKMLLIYACIGLVVSAVTVLFHCSKDVQIKK
ncbi:MAG: hypothetical protein IJW70_11650 [Clostridia bacterium]|nr:hypothetical protein [Clostridia bacterium]